MMKTQSLPPIAHKSTKAQVLPERHEKVLWCDSPHYGVGTPFVVVERVVVNHVPTAMEIIRKVDERVTAIQK